MAETQTVGVMDGNCQAGCCCVGNLFVVYTLIGYFPTDFDSS